MINNVKKWVWEHENYPNFPYNKEKIKEKLRSLG